MPTSLTTAMEREVRQFTHRIHPVIELTLGGSVYRFAESPIASESQGLYLPYVTEIGDKRRTANATEFSLETPRVSFSIYDATRTLQKLFGGPLRGMVRNSAAKIWWRSFGGPDNGITSADHFLSFSGVVLDVQITERIYRFTAGANIDALDAPVKIPPWAEEDWPLAPEETFGAPNRVIYGHNSSAGIEESFGMYQCVPLKEEANGDVDVWGVCHGAVSVPRIFIGETLSTSSFSVGRATRGKNYSTILTYTAGGTHPNRDSDIRCDVDGLTTLPDGTGTLIENPAQQIRHFLANFVYGTGEARPFAAWASEVGLPIDASIFADAEDFYRYRNWTGAFSVSSGETGRSVLDEHGHSFNAVPFFSADWEIAAIPRDNDAPALYFDDRHVAQLLQMAKGDLKLSTRRRDPVSDLQISYLLDEARNAYARSHLVAWRRGGTVVERPFEMKYGRRSL